MKSLRGIFAVFLAITFAVAIGMNVFQVDVPYTNLNMGTVGMQAYLLAVDNAPPGTYDDSITAVVGPDDSYAIFNVDENGIPSEENSGTPGTWNDGQGDCDGNCFFEPY